MSNLRPRSGLSPGGGTADALAGAAVLGAGLALAAAVPPYSLYVLAWFALVPLLLRWEGIPDGRRAWLEASAAYLVYYVCAGWWGWNHPFLEPALSASAPLLLLPIVLGGPWALGVAVRRRWGRTAGVLVLAGGTLAVEWALHRGPIALPWLVLSHTQAEAFPFNQLVAPLGSLGLSAWVWAVNLAGWTTLCSTPGTGTGTGRRAKARAAAGPERSGRPLPGWSGPLLLALLVGGAWWYGSARMDAAGSVRDGTSVAGPRGSADSVRAHEGAAVVRAAIVQSGLDALTWTRRGTGRIELLLHLSDSVLTRSERERGLRPELVLWPEAALPSRGAAPGDSLRRRIARWTRERGVHLLTGATVSAGGRTAGYNAALLFGPTGRTVRYEKRRLVPFAERVPLSQLWTPLSRLALDAGGRFRYLRGDGPPVVHTGPLGPGKARVGLGVLICFESLFGRLARRARAEGADVLAVLAQDGWWGRTPGYRQHFAFTRLRAIETGLPLLMVSVNGRSGLIRPDGRAPRTLGWGERGVLEVDVPLGP